MDLETAKIVIDELNRRLRTVNSENAILRGRLDDCEALQKHLRERIQYLTDRLRSDGNAPLHWDPSYPWGAGEGDPE